ncbi:MAG: hypothetical protein WA971_13020 [Microbacterium sp.]
MSLNALRTRPQQAPERAPERRLHALAAPARRRRPKLGYAILALAGAVVIGAAQLGLSLAATQDSFVLAELNAQQRSLNLDKQALQDELVGLSSPQSLAVKAADLGLVVAGSASYLRLSDGAVLGTTDDPGWTSTVNPKGPEQVGNALLAAPQAPASGTEKKDKAAQADEAADTPVTPTLPPALTDGLPTPETH